MTNKLPLVYITSPSYSGSTLLTLLLGAHPDVATVGEMKAQAMGDVERYRCSCGTLIRECGFWRSVTEEMRRRGLAFDVGAFGLSFGSRNLVIDRALQAGVRGPVFEATRRAFLGVWPGAAAQIQSILQRNERFAEILVELTGSRFVVDGSKDPVRLAFLLGSSRFDVYVIHLTRDGRGVANSYRSHERMSIDRGGREFVRSHEEAERVLSTMPRDRVLRVVYEQLCSSPEQVMRDVFEYIGVDPERSPKDLGDVEHHVLGNSMRLRTITEIRCDTKWQRELDNEDLRKFEAVGGAINRAYGYA